MEELERYQVSHGAAAAAAAPGGGGGGGGARTQRFSVGR